MKIKTITCHEVYNHGASLQEFALLNYINSLGHQAEAIHYKPPYLSNHFKLNAVSNPRFDKPFVKQLYLLAKLPGRVRDLQRKKAFDAFAKQHIPTDTILYKNNAELKANLPDAEVFICGSDQIWNSFFENGKDPAFYLDFVPENKLKISYAASFAIDEIDDYLKDFVRDSILRLNHVSVRETSGLKILSDLGIEVGVQVLDPVFLLDSIIWKEKFIRPLEEQYIFVYDCDSNKQIKAIAQKAAKEKGLKIYTVDKNIKYADKNFYFEAPDVFLSLIFNAQYVLTNSFHALAFSLIFRKKLLVFNRNEKINTRMRDLMDAVGISHLLIGYNQFKDVSEIDIDYEEVHKKLEFDILKSKKFLNDSLENYRNVRKN